MTVDELSMELENYHGDLQVILRSDLGDTIDDFEDFEVTSRDVNDTHKVVISF